MRIVLDPEVLVRGVLDPQAPEGRLLDLALTGTVTVLCSDGVLQAWRMALARPEFELPPRAIDQLVDFFAETGAPVVPSGALGTCSPLVALATDGCADAFVATGRSRFPTGSPRLRTCSASAVLDALAPPSPLGATALPPTSR